MADKKYELTFELSDGSEKKVPFTAPQGPVGSPGEPGKSAYAYAQDGGYTGTEAEFAAKLAEEAPKTFYVVITDNGDGTGTSDKTYAEILAAHGNGSTIIARIDTTGMIGVIQNVMTVDEYDQVIQCAVSGATADGMFWVAIIVDSSTIVANMPIIPEALKNPNALTINGTSYDGSKASVVKSAFYVTLNSDNTADKTVAEIYAAYKAGYVINCVVAAMGNVVLPLLMANETLAGFGGIAGASSIMVQITGEQSGMVQTTIPSDDYINAMIDTKLNAIGVAEEGSY